jgi:phage tail-like protein
MSCIPGQPTFRLLDPRVGWSVAAAERLVSLDGESELRLAPRARIPGEDPAAVAGVFGDPRLARGCGPCDWYFLSPAPRPTLLRLGCDVPCPDLRCGERPDGLAARPVSHRSDAPYLPGPVAVAARGHVFAVADRILRQLLVWDGAGSHLIARLSLDADPVAVALAPWGEVLVAVTGSGPIRRFGMHGGVRAAAPWQLPAQVIAIAFARPQSAPEPSDDGVCPVLLLIQDQDGALSVWRAERNRAEVLQIDLAQALALTEPSGIAAVGKEGFCVSIVHEGLPAQQCWSWHGKPIDGDSIAAPAPRPLHTHGQLLTKAIDSGIPRCQWHRLRVDAEVPPGTGLQIAVASSDQGDDQPPQGAETDPQWAGFQAGVPHPDDWEQLPSGASDALLSRPPGRYLFVRVRLTGNGVLTPVVHSIRLDFPRRTSLNDLPEVWQDDPAAADFTARFLSLFDAQLEDLDKVIERYPALLDSAHVPDAVLPWLAGLLALGFDPAWTASRRRALVQAAPELYRLRGTPQGLRRAIELVLGVVPVIEELGAARAWGALSRREAPSRAVLGSVRLFGPSRVRFRLDRSRLSQAPIRSLGDPRRDAQGSGAYRFRVLVPPSRGAAVDVPSLERLISRQAPAHTVATVRVGGTGLVVGQQFAIGVDTLLVGQPAPILGGAGTGAAGSRGVLVRLNRRSVLWPGRRRVNTAIRAGDRAVVGINTVVR